MGLSNDLLSQFAKATNDNKATKSNGSSGYGTVTIVDGKKFVQLDGSDLLTPVSTTADVRDGDRVIVTITNHIATITGNLTSPSARTGDVIELGNRVTELDAEKVSTKVLEAQVARIDTLVSENVTINGKLNANEADISTLKADNVTIHGALTANNAEIDNLKTSKLDADVANLTYATIANLNAAVGRIGILESDYVTVNQTLTAHKGVIDELSSTYATISELNAAKADIGVLGADIADINVLMFGSATGEVIQTSFANAVVAQLGNAQIKSAMIDTVSASKIAALNLLAGTINSKNVTIESEDGNLAIADETIQISDDTRVRVQIGKDASGDYSINIWDAEGKLMFSEGGLTENAVKDAIIRNDMVASDAAIDAGKLDIDSLFEEINGSSKTIKSSKVYLDKEKQTLDLAFTTLTDNVSSQGTAISVIQDRITSKVWQQDINEATDAMSTQYSTLEQNLGSFKTTVGNTYATKGEVESSILSVTQTATDLTTRLYTVEHTGTDYMNFSFKGLIVGDMIADTLGSNVLIDSDSVDIRNGDTTLASFKKNSIELGLNTDDSEISLCGGRGLIYLDKYGTDANHLTIKGQGDLRLYANDRLFMSAFNASQDGTHIQDNSSINMGYSTYTDGTVIGRYISMIIQHWENNTLTQKSRLTLDIDRVDMSGPSIDIRAITGDTEIYASNGNFLVYSKNFSLSDEGLDMKGYLTVSGNIYLTNNRSIYGRNTSGVERHMININNNNNLVIGFGGYDGSEGATNLYGNAVNIFSNGNINLKAPVTFTNAATTRANLGVWTYDTTTDTSYPGLARPDGGTDFYTRATQDGFLPYAKAATSMAVDAKYGCNVGTQSWPFDNGYFKSLYAGAIYIPNNSTIYSRDSGDTNRAVMTATTNGYVDIGRGFYDAGVGGTILYGQSIKHYVKSANANYKPYYEAGDSISSTWWTNGHTTNGGKEFRFTVWLAKPVIGNPTVTITTTNGLYLRQNTNYLCGGSNDKPIVPSSYKPGAINTDGNAIRITAVLPNTTDVINNEACAGVAEIKITFS